MTHPDDPAYPMFCEQSGPQYGLTKREAFAMAAMQGLLASGQLKDIIETCDDPCATVAIEAVGYANAMLAELAAGKE